MTSRISSCVAAIFRPSAPSNDSEERPGGRSFPTCAGQLPSNLQSSRRCFFALIYGVIETGRFFYVKSALQNAVDDTGRFAMTTPSASATAIINYAQASVLESVSNGTTFTVTPDTVGSTNLAYPVITHTHYM